MRISRLACLSILPLALGAMACGDDIRPSGNTDSGPNVDGSTPDAPGPDAFVCPAPVAASAGAACALPEDCAGAPDNPDGGAPPEGQCFTDQSFPIQFPSEGFCIYGCLDDGECRDGESCIFNTCVQNCCDDGSCPTNRICTDKLFGNTLPALGCWPGTNGAPDGAACSTFENCEENSNCRNDQFQYPGGQCFTLGCAIDADCAAGGDGRCVDLVGDGAPAVCIDDCTQDSDCRLAEGYRCVDEGAAGMYCRHPAPRDDCVLDADCGTGDANDPWVCRTGAQYPGGYCTVENCTVGDSTTCPLFSHCVDLGDGSAPYCADECDRLGVNPCDNDYECAILPPDNTETGCVPFGIIPPPN